VIRAAILIRVDWIAGGVAGVLMLTFREWLAGLYSLPVDLVLLIGIVNLAYAGVSFTLCQFSQGDRVPFLRVMAGANIAWAICCLALAVSWLGVASVFGMVQLVGEAIFVGGLGVLEWQARVTMV